MTAELPFPLCQATWAKMLKNEEADPSKGFGSNFYRILFADVPSLVDTTFFNVKHSEQSMNLQRFITVALSLLVDMPKAVDALTQLGLRHIGYGVFTEGEYAVVGQYVIKTLKHVLGADMTEEAVAEWVALYGVIQKTCMDAVTCDRADAFFKRLYKKQAGTMKALLSGEGVDTTKCGFSTAAFIAALDALSTEQDTANCEKLAQAMSADQLKDFEANMIAALEAAKKTPSAFEKYIVKHFAGHFNKFAAKKN